MWLSLIYSTSEIRDYLPRSRLGNLKRVRMDSVDLVVAKRGVLLQTMGYAYFLMSQQLEFVQCRHYRIINPKREQYSTIYYHETPESKSHYIIYTMELPRPVPTAVLGKVYSVCTP
jgi:hypothetical protein